MQCDRCKNVIEEGEEREHAGRILCEDCYMDALSPARTCDPWPFIPPNPWDMEEPITASMRSRQESSRSSRRREGPSSRISPKSCR